MKQQFPFVYEQEPNYNQNYDDNYYPHESLSFPCCDYCGESHETFQCQPDNQNVDFSGSDKIQTLQYPDVNPPSLEISNEEIFQAKGDLMKSIQTFLEKFNCIPFEEKPQILFQTWETFSAIQCSQPDDSNELFQKLLKDLKELAEYDQSTIQEPPRESDICQLIEECSVEVPEEQKQKMENTMFELVKICHHKEILCIHDDIDNLIESALDSKLLSINSQSLDKKEQKVKNIEERPAGRRNRAEKSLQNFRVVHKSSISVNSTSQISSVHAVTQIQSTKEPEHLLSMGYEYLSITPETESDEVTESNAENLLPIPREADLFLSDDSIPPGIENVTDDPEGDVRFLEELLINDSILSHESFDSNLEENPSIPRPPPEPPDVESFFDLKPIVIAEEISDKLNEDKCFDPGREINVSTKIEDDDYFPFMFVIRFFLSYFIFPEVSPLLLSAESKDTIFDPGISY
uniref:Reverse transcriptase domain-containing protein n=1 Tax=Tanacetum cinerariifolium TaxID=118510 RepID=A0A699JTY8_TANCI|nr:hypothetical protein [Tanacetum cinerariifolium]